MKALIEAAIYITDEPLTAAQIAGALGRPTWVMLPITPDYRWLLGRSDSLWYPTMRLFRQGATRDYAAVLEEVRAALSALAKCAAPFESGMERMQ